MLCMYRFYICLRLLILKTTIACCPGEQVDRQGAHTCSNSLGPEQPNRGIRAVLTCQPKPLIPPPGHTSTDCFFKVKMAQNGIMHLLLEGMMQSPPKAQVCSQLRLT